MENKLQTLLACKPIILLDGAMGTMLQQNGLKPGERPELFILSHPETVTKIHRMYLESGSNILYTCTFGANRCKLAGTGVSPEEVIRGAVAAAKKAADEFPGEKPLIALDIGPTGELLYPAGPMHFEEMYEIFKEQVIAGEKAGADLVVFETMADLGEIRAAILAAKENTSLPVLSTMAFEAGGRTFIGCPAESMAHTLTGLGVDALGINCSLGPKEIFPIAQRIAACTDLPLVIKANAGLPDGKDGSYQISPAEFARQMEPYRQLGIRFTGGCCGTDPEYIAELKKVFADYTPVKRESGAPAFCSAVKTVPAEGLHMAGERINPTGKPALQQSLLDGETEDILDLAMDQDDAGAELLDVNISCPGVDQPAMMGLAVEEIQGAAPLPLMIDTTDPEAAEAGLRAFHGIGILNSVSGDPKSLEKLLPAAKKYGAFLVGLTMDEKGLPETAEERLAIARRIADAAEAAGISRKKILIDCLTLTAAASPEQTAETLRAIRLVREELGLLTVLGVSNISFGLPDRVLLNRCFLSEALSAGLNLAIINPNQKELTDTIFAFRALHGLDPDCAAYISRFSGK